jgi:hypothetical protein
MVAFEKLEKGLVWNSSYRGLFQDITPEFALRDEGRLQNHEILVRFVDVESDCYVFRRMKGNGGCLF